MERLVKMIRTAYEMKATLIRKVDDIYLEALNNRVLIKNEYGNGNLICVIDLDDEDDVVIQGDYVLLRVHIKDICDKDVMFNVRDKKQMEILDKAYELLGGKRDTLSIRTVCKLMKQFEDTEYICNFIYNLIDKL